MHRSWTRHLLAAIARRHACSVARPCRASEGAAPSGALARRYGGAGGDPPWRNQVNKRPPYLPSAIGFGADDIAVIAAEGFNTVRTGLIHKGLAPAPGVYDTAYLDDLAATVSLMTAEGIYVLIDFHQDLYGERYQGEGMAEWATVDSSPGDPTTVPACNLGFPGNIFSCPFMWEAFDRFLGLNGHAPEIGPRSLTLQEEFADAWRQVATRFKDEPLVFGYNLLNEPYPGSSTPFCLSLAGCPGTADAQLTVFSNLVADAIREVDPDTIVFYEPYATNFNAGFPTHHGDVDVANVGFSFHLYACLNGGTAEACGPREQTVFANANAQADAFAHAPLLTEFGATDDYATIERIVAGADANRVGWQYWAWWNRDPCCESADEGVIDDPANPPTPAHLNEAKLDVLVRPYPRAVAGTPLSWSFDRAARRFTMTYATTPVDGALAPGAVDRSVDPGERQFPGGYDIVDLSRGAGRPRSATPSACNSWRSPARRRCRSRSCRPRAARCRHRAVGSSPANGGSLARRRSPDAKDRLQWSWVNGTATTEATTSTTRRRPRAIASAYGTRPPGSRAS